MFRTFTLGVPTAVAAGALSAARSSSSPCSLSSPAGLRHHRAAPSVCCAQVMSTCEAIVRPALSVSSRTFFTATTPRLQEQQHPQQPPPPTDGSGAAGAKGSDETAMDVAVRVNRMKKAHQSNSGGAAGRRQIEGEAWEILNSLSEEQVNTAEGKAVALLLNAWAYFAKFWEKGRDGPAPAAAAAGGGGGEAPSTPPPASP